MDPGHPSRHSREHLRYASDVSDEEWALLEPHLPAPCLTGRPRAWPMREIVSTPILYVLRSGCAWRLLPDSFPPRQRSTAGSCGCATTAFWSG